MSIGQRRIKHLNDVDNMPSDIKECVHEFGLPIVYVLLKFGIDKPEHIREVVREIWSGGRQDGQGAGARDMIDFAISRNLVSYEGLLRLLKDSHLAIVPMNPTRAMLDASMRTVSEFNRKITKEHKHRLRLTAAIKASMEEF